MFCLYENHGIICLSLEGHVKFGKENVLCYHLHDLHRQWLTDRGLLSRKPASGFKALKRMWKWGQRAEILCGLLLNDLLQVSHIAWVLENLCSASAYMAGVFHRDLVYWLNVDSHTCGKALWKQNPVNGSKVLLWFVEPRKTDNWEYNCRRWARTQTCLPLT